MKTLSLRSSWSIVGLTFLFAMALPLVVSAAGPLPVDLLSADHFALLAKAGISTTGPTTVVGDVGVSPAAATSLTGFTLNLSAGSSFATSPEVDGNVYAPDYANPTPANITTAISDMQTAYTDAAGRTNPTATELGAGNIGGLTIVPGLYAWSTNVIIPTNVTLSGGANDVWIFQIAQNLTVSSNVNIVLSGGAQPGNIFWVVAGQTTLGTTAVFSGTILDQTAIVLNTGAVLNGRALAQTAITLDANAVTLVPTVVAANPVPSPIPVAPLIPIETPNAPMPSTVNNNVPTPVSLNAPVMVSAPIISTPIYARDLAFGSTGADVTALQQLLVSKQLLVWPAGVAYGYFGPLTRTALMKLQAGWRLPITGLVDANTRLALNPTNALPASRVYENTYMQVTLPSTWTASQAPQNPAAVNIMNGKYILYINTQASQASGVPGGRFAEIGMGAPSVDAVVTVEPGDCGSTVSNPAYQDFTRVDYYVRVQDKQNGCTVPTNGQTVWFFSYLTSPGNGFFNDYTLGQNPALVVTMSYNSSDVNAFPIKGDDDLNTALAAMTQIASTLIIK